MQVSSEKRVTGRPHPRESIDVGLSRREPWVARAVCAPFRSGQSMKTSQSTAANTAAGPGRTGLGTSTGQRLPVPPRERKPALAALAVLLILGGALTSAYLVMPGAQGVSAIGIAQPVAAGQPIPDSALEEVQI